MSHTLLRLLFISALLGGVALFALSNAHAEEEAKEEKKDATPAKTEGVFVQRKSTKLDGDKARLELGRTIKGVAKPRLTDWFGGTAVSGQVHVSNPTDKEVFTSVSFVVYDKDGKVLGATSQSMSADPKEETIWGGFLVQLPKAQLAKIASVEYVWYEDSQEIGKR